MRDAGSKADVDRLSALMVAAKKEMVGKCERAVVEIKEERCGWLLDV